MFPTSFLLHFHPDEKCDLTKIRPSDKSPVYITYGNEKRGDKTYNVMTLSFHYDENMAQGIGWQITPRSTSLGYHLHDIEYVSIYDYNDKPEKVFFSAHSQKQGNWVNWNDCKLSNNNEFSIYVALNSHANYPQSGRTFRIFGFANDLCSGEGKTVRINTNEMTPSYNFTFPNGISLYKSLRPSPPEDTLSKWQKFALPLYS